MELRHLRYFIAVAQEENISRAALKLHVSQPALSRQVRDLEEELGFLLLERTGKSVSLTEAGKVFLSGARVVLQRSEDAVAAARKVALRGTAVIHVGYSPTPTVRFLPKALRFFQRHQKGVKVTLHDNTPEEMISGLRDGKLQLAFLVRPARSRLRGLEFEELERDHMRLAVSSTHPLANRREISVDQLGGEKLLAYARDDYPEYHSYLEQLFATMKGRPRVTEEHAGGSSLITSIESGSGVALLPQSLELTTGSRIHLIPIVPAPPPLIIGAAWSPAGMSPLAGELLQCARKVTAPGQKASASAEGKHPNAQEATAWG